MANGGGFAWNVPEMFGHKNLPKNTVHFRAGIGDPGIKYNMIFFCSLKLEFFERIVCLGLGSTLFIRPLLFRFLLMPKGVYQVPVIRESSEGCAHVSGCPSCMAGFR